jgi:hypothetical protein
LSEDNALTRLVFGYIINLILKNEGKILMKKTTGLLLCLSLAVFLSGGCASFNFQSLAGINISDLEQARADGKVKVVPLPYDAAFDKVMDIVKKNGLTAFRYNKKRGFIVAIGFPKQETTTRVGIFFEPVDENSTKITLSSLSNTALAKAQSIIFGGLDQ